MQPESDEEMTQAESQPDEEMPNRHEDSEEEEEDIREDAQDEEEDEETLEEKQEIRIVRQKYRDLLGETEEDQLAKTESADKILARLKKANDLFAKVKSTNDATLDAKLLVKSSELGSMQLRQARSDVQLFDMDMFMKKVFAYMSEDGENILEEGWKKLGDLGKKYSKAANSPNFLLGPLSVQIKKRVATQRHRIDKNAPLVRPEELKSEDIKTTDETTRNIAAVHACLKENGPMPFWRFVLNPNSFSQTIENAFYTAFLAKDGKISVQTTFEGDMTNIPPCADGDAIIGAVAVDPSEEENMKLPRFQYMLSFDYETWKKLIAKYNVTSPVIPHRNASDDAEEDRLKYLL